MRRFSLGLLAATAMLIAVPSAASAATISNGGFETGDFSGWQVDEEGLGDWNVYSGDGPASIPAPPEGTFGAVTTQVDHGSNVLFRDVVLESGMTHVLSFQVYYDNTAPAFFTPNSLSHNDEPNQQYRVDVTDPAADLRSVAPEDVLLEIFRTDPGEPQELDPTLVTADLSAFAGQTVRLRFAEVDTVHEFNAAVDAVEITSTSPPAVTPPPPPPNCFGKPATIVGTPNRDTIRGTPGRDVIVAFAGKDTVVGLRGNDIVCGNRGSDRIFGSAGKDKLIGGAKKDQLFGGRGRDLLKGKAGRDLLNGGRKRDRLLGGKGFDRCKGKQGRDKAKGCEQELGIP